MGVSGGPDSVALLHILHMLAPDLSLKLGVGHLNHGLRQNASDRDAEFVAELAGRLGLPLFEEKVNVRKYARKKRLSIEEAARELRYAFLYKVAETYGYNRIALGHHRDDNAELVLMFLIRGSGPLGISGIPPVRNGQIIRPLIERNRRELREFLNTRKIPFVSDHSNTDPRYWRNRVRHQLIPTLEASYNPRISEILNRLSEIVRDEDQWMDEIINPIFNGSIVSTGKDHLILAADKIQRVPVAVKRRILRKAIFRVKGDLRRISFSHIETIIDLLKAGPDRRSLHLPNRICVAYHNGLLAISRAKVSLRSLGNRQNHGNAPAFEYTLSEPGSVFIKEIDARLTLSETTIKEIPAHYGRNRQMAFFDIQAVGFPLTLRNFRAGDRFQPLGMAGTQKVKKFLINNKIDRTERMRIPILLSRGKIIWIAGHRIDETVKLTPLTTNVLQAELLYLPA